MKLTEEDIEITCFEKYVLHIETTKTRADAEQLKQQILENQIKAKKYDNNMKGIKELLGFDSINDLKNEYLQLKSQLNDYKLAASVEADLVDCLQEQNRELNKIVEKVRELSGVPGIDKEYAFDVITKLLPKDT